MRVLATEYDFGPVDCRRELRELITLLQSDGKRLIMKCVGRNETHSISDGRPKDTQRVVEMSFSVDGRVVQLTLH